MTAAPAGRDGALRGVPVLLAFIAVFIAAVNLRAGIASLGPVLSDVLAAFGAGGEMAGAVTALPGLFFAVMGLLAVPLASRFGLSTMLTAGMVLTLIGLAVRPWMGDIWIFLVLTASVVAGIALANVLLPAWIKSHGGRHIVALMTIYTSVLGLSGAVGPLSALLFEWRGALFVWSFLAAAQVVVWLVVAARTGYDFPSGARTTVVPDEAAPVDTAPEAGVTPTAPAGWRRESLWRAPTAVFLMLFFGLQSTNAYIQMGWLPQIYRDAGVSPAVGSVGLALVGALNVIGGLVMPTVLARVRSAVLLPVLFSILTAVGYAGLLVVPDVLPLLWAIILGVGGFCFPTALALIPASSRDPLVTARLSGFVQPFGYCLAAVGPFLVGVAYGRSGDWTLILAVLILATVLMAVFGSRAARRGFIDDELIEAARRRPV
ncbi:MFS transporter [Brevibacterium senegalense]|uniref:MFS transporter n=1 Tax=Brevibacterium senegalense TaxID=1033736 RepID=UPI00058E2989|nr:MFS transporter [Brevibacterium senegalense]